MTDGTYHGTLLAAFATSPEPGLYAPETSSSARMSRMSKVCLRKLGEIAHLTRDANQSTTGRKQNVREAGTYFANDSK